MNNRISAMDEKNGEGRMDKVTLSETTREKVEEAMLSVFMEQYGAAMDVGVEIKMAECADMEFPPELDKRIQKLIAGAQAEKKKKQRRKAALRVLRSAAAVIMVLLSVSSVLFMTVEAIRVPVMNFFVEETKLYWEISTNDKSSAEPEVFNEKNPMEGILPDEFELVFIDGSLEKDNLIADYRDSNQRSVSLVICLASGSTQMDTENANTSKFKLAGYDAILSAESNAIRIMWVNNNIDKVFSVCTMNMESAEVISISEEIAKLF